MRAEATRGSLGEIAEILRQTPHVVNLVGHTDDVPIHSERFPAVLWPGPVRSPYNLMDET